MKRLHPRRARAGDVLLKIVHEQAIRNRHAQTLGSQMINARVRLENAFFAGDDDHVERIYQLVLREELTQLRRKVGEQRRLDSAGAGCG